MYNKTHILIGPALEQLAGLPDNHFHTIVTSPRISGSKHNGFSDIKTTGWETDCDCDSDAVPCRVLDPFGGSGTTAMVSNRLQRDATIIEISPDYADMAAKRISDDGGFLVDVVVEAN